MSVVVLAASWLLAARPAAPAVDLEPIAAHHDRLSRLLDQHQIRYTQWTVDDGRRALAVEVDQATDGPRWRQTITHAGPGFETLELARAHDPRRNHTFVAADRHFQFWEKRREVRRFDVPVLPPNGLNLGEHTTKTFLTSALLRPWVDRPLDVFAAAEPRAYRCRWRDLMLPEALRLPGWARVEPPDRFPAALHLQREVAPGFVDDLWLDPARGHGILHREFSFGPAQRLVYEYDDLTEVAPGFWLPLTCRWRNADGHRMEERTTTFRVGPPPAALFDFQAPAGTRTVDRAGGLVAVEPGGSDLLAEIVEDVRSNFHLPQPGRPRGWPGWWAPGLIAAVVLVGIVARPGTRPAVRPRRAVARGVTLVEVLVVVSIIGLLVALLLPAVQDARRAAARLQCQNNLKQIGLGVHQYAGTYGQLPAGQLVLSSSHAYAGEYRRSVFVAILPYLEQGPLYQQFNFTVIEYDLANITVDLARPGWLACPSDPDAAPIRSIGPAGRNPIIDPPGGTYPTAVTSYGFALATVLYPWGDGPWPVPDPLGQLNGCFNVTPNIDYAAITDGLSHTLFGGERAVGYANRTAEYPVGRWTGARGQATLLSTMTPLNSLLKSPPPINGNSYASMGFSSLHPGGANMLIGDGSVRFIRETVDCWPINPLSGRPGEGRATGGGFVDLPPQGVWQALTTRAGGEAVADREF